MEENHRQGNGKEYADLLNRVRMGQHTKDDINLLKTRERKKGHKDLKGALFISALVVPVANFNKKALMSVCKQSYSHSTDGEIIQANY